MTKEFLKFSNDDPYEGAIFEVGNHPAALVSSFVFNDSKFHVFTSSCKHFWYKKAVLITMEGTKKFMNIVNHLSYLWNNLFWGLVFTDLYDISNIASINLDIIRTQRKFGRLFRLSHLSTNKPSTAASKLPLQVKVLLYKL